EQQEPRALLRPQLRGRHLRERVDDAAQEREEQGFEGADHRRQQRRGEQVLAQSLRAPPLEREECPRRRLRHRVGVGIDQAFEYENNGGSDAYERRALDGILSGSGGERWIAARCRRSRGATSGDRSARGRGRPAKWGSKNASRVPSDILDRDA